MPATLPAYEPATIVAGYSTGWYRDLPDYPTATYTLKYVFRRIDGCGGASTFTSTSDGINKHLVELTAAQVAPLTAGTYSVVGYVIDDATEGATTKLVVFSGTIDVRPDPAAASALDRRSHARKMVDLLREGLYKLASGTTSSVSIQGKSFTMRSLAEMRGELARYEAIVNDEDARARGISPQGRIYVRMNEPT